ncbi:MAG: HipA family kinase [Polaribacter sp.]|uniref:HipA family kinase n=1 Tax=Polaribacter sp. TaxID=1920175 RepID=UPI003EF8C110
MLKKLDFISQKGIIDGGTTKPVIIEAINEKNEIGQYVVKIFTKKHERDNFSTSKEFISSFLASEFDLNTPEYFVINIKKEYVSTIFTEEQIEEREFGYHFCTKFIPGCLPYNLNAKNYFLKGYDYENIFSFDCLMLNNDRGGYRKKPNLLIKNQDFYLIDHELTLPFYSNPNGQRASYDVKTYFAQSRHFNMSTHIFYHFLKNKKNKNQLFHEFNLNLNQLNLSQIENLFKDFTKFNIRNDGTNGLCDYLLWCKSNNYVMNTLTKKII